MNIRYIIQVTNIETGDYMYYKFESADAADTRYNAMKEYKTKNNSPVSIEMFEVNYTKVKEF